MTLFVMILINRAEIIEAEKQKKDIRSIVLPSRALKASDHAKSTSSTTSSVPENSKR